MRMRWTRWTLGLLGLALVACEDDPSPVARLADTAGYRVEIDGQPFRLRLIDPAGRVRTRIDRGGLGIGRVDSYDPGFNYDPYLAVEDPINDPEDPPGLTWVSVDAVLSATTGADAAQLVVRLSDGGSATLEVRREGEGSFALRLAVPDAGREVPGAPDAVYTYANLRVDPAEELYGLGEVFDAVTHRGRIHALQMEVAGTESMNNEAHVRIPVLVSTGAWGVFVDTLRPGVVDVAATDPDTLRVVVNDPAAPIHLLVADEPLAVTERFAARTALPALPPVWAFAPIQWRNEVDGQDMVLEDASAIRQHGIPTGAIWVDRPWEVRVNSLEFEPGMFPDAPAMVEELHAQGFRLAAWSTPYLPEDDPAFPAAETGDYFPEGTLIFQTFGKLLDLTDPAAMAFWQDRVTAAIGRGIEGFKLDYAEDVQLGLSRSRLRLDFGSGEDERTMHHQYATYYHRAYAEPLGGSDHFIIARAGTIRGQQYASVIWPGDLCSDFRDFGEQDDEGTVHVGGLPSAVRAGLGLSVAGYPFFASDIGGFRHARPTHEVMIRWTEYAALLPIMQYGGGGANHNPWDLSARGESQFTPETIDLFRRYAVLHTRLFPYFYTYARAAHATGRPVIRPWGLAYPADGRHPDDAFLTGPDLLVAPLVRGGTTRDVPLPPGGWIDWWTGDRVEGPADLPVTAPLGTLPLYLREGGIVPMLRPTVMTLSPVDDPGIDSYATDPGRLHGRAVPPVDGTATLTLHDGTVIRLAADLTFSVTPGESYAGLQWELWSPAAATVRLLDAEVPEVASEAELETCDACWYRAPGSPWVWVAVVPGSLAPVVLHLE